MADLKTSDCTACVNREATGLPGYKAHRCKANGFYVGTSVLQCSSFKRAHQALKGEAK